MFRDTFMPAAADLGDGVIGDDNVRGPLGLGARAAVSGKRRFPPTEFDIGANCHKRGSITTAGFADIGPRPDADSNATLSAPRATAPSYVRGTSKVPDGTAATGRSPAPTSESRTR